MSCYTGEDSLWIITTGAKNWRIDFDERDKRPFTFLSTFTAFSGKELVYQSKLFETGRPLSFSHIRVEADSYPVGVSFLSIDQQSRADVLITDDRVYRLPQMRREREWYIRINSLSTVVSVEVATTPGEISGN